MEISIFRKLTKWAAILSLAGVLVIIVNFIGANLIYSTSGEKAATNFSMPLAIIIGIIGLASLVLGIVLFINLPKVGKPFATGVLLIVAGVFAWFYFVVPLFAWIFAAVQLFRLKFDDEPKDNQLIL